MSCAITAGYVIDCNKDSLGGLSKVRIAAKKDIVSIAETAGVISAVVMQTGTQFYDFALVKSTSSFSNAITSNPTNGSMFYAQSATLIFNKLKSATSALVDSLCRASLVLIVEDRNGEIIMLGRENGMDVSGGTIGSGTAGGDRSGYELQLTGEESKTSHVDPTIMAALLLPAS
ncbi:MAG: hypothetical protein ABIN67_13790 [Ferruginibacter sp.]